MSAPQRVLAIVREIADQHEVPADDIWNKAAYDAAEQARIDCYRKVFQAPKANGAYPTPAEVARWFNVSRSAVSRAVKDLVQEAA